jgi:hypothetical protein
LKIGKDITAEQLQRLQKTVAELVGAKVIDRSLEGLLTECLSKLGKEVKEEIADLADDVRKDLMVGMARAIKNGVSTQLMATVLSHDLIRQYGRVTFLDRLTKFVADDVENLKELFEELGDGSEAALFEFHAGVKEAKERGKKVTHFRIGLVGASHRADADAVIDGKKVQKPGDKIEGIHIHATLRNLPDPSRRGYEDVDACKSTFGRKIAVSRANGALKIKFILKRQTVTPDLQEILNYLTKKSKI